MILIDSLSLSSTVCEKKLPALKYGMSCIVNTSTLLECRLVLKGFIPLEDIRVLKDLVVVFKIPIVLRGLVVYAVPSPASLQRLALPQTRMN